MPQSFRFGAFFLWRIDAWNGNGKSEVWVGMMLG